MKRSAVVPALLAAMLSACSEFQPYIGVRSEPVTPHESSVSSLLVELHNTRSMNKEQLQETLNAWEREYQADPSGDHRLRLALLYASGSESVRDPERARELLTEAEGTLNNPADTELAAMVRQFLDDQFDANRKVNSLTKQMAVQSKRIAELEQKQRALMNIEQKIQQRDTAPVIDNGK
jgi:hypothetical protein